MSVRPSARTVTAARVVATARAGATAFARQGVEGALRRAAPCLMLAFSSALPAQAIEDPALERRRAAMITAIDAGARATEHLTGRARFRLDVMQALATVPRHAFVPSAHTGEAYENRPLPIGYGQTISQPYIVALMTDLLEPAPQHTVLEIGTGSGYQAAILSPLVRHVYTIEIIEPLAREASLRLANLGYHNVTTRLGDGYHGWPEQAPFDAIIVTAAASHVPPPLIAQLRPGGRLVIPVGSRFAVQQLLLVEKQADGSLVTRQVLPVRFVPLTGQH